MSFPRIQVVGFAAVILGSTQAAYAGHWGTDQEAQACEKEYSDSKKWEKPNSYPYPINDALKSGQVSAPCKAEIEKRAKSCMSDPNMQSIYNDASNANPHKDPPGFCSYRAFGEISDALMNVGLAKEREAAKAKAAEEKKAKEAAQTAAVEMPKAGKHDASLEKAVAAAYDRDYPGNKILKVILGSWSTDYEKDAFGKITGRDLDATVVNKHPDGTCELHYELWEQHGNGKSFSGPLAARGAGSMTKTEILCSKAEAGAGAAAPSSTKKHK